MKLLNPQGNFVCTWCAETFTSKVEMLQHRIDSPSCGQNATVSNPLQSKYAKADVVQQQPGEYTLHKVRAPTCKHEGEMRELKHEDGAVFGVQCMYCYTWVMNEQG